MRVDNAPVTFSKLAFQKPPHDQRVASVAPWPFCGLRTRALAGSDRGVLEDALATVAPQSVALKFEGLVVQGDAGVADLQGFCPDWPENVSNHHTMTSGHGLPECRRWICVASAP